MVCISYIDFPSVLCGLVERHCGELQRLLHSSNAVIADVKVMQAVKLYINKILQFITESAR